MFKFALTALAAMIPFAPSSAGDTRAYVYGPMTAMGDGYHEKQTKDGFLQIEAGVGYGRAQAMDVAIYRAAELAKQSGHRYVEIHDASEKRTGFGAVQALLYARPVALPVHPAACRSGKANRCYTADVELVFARLSGDDMHHPGLAAASAIDQYGRTVYESGFGTGAVGTAPR